MKLKEFPIEEQELFDWRVSMTAINEFFVGYGFFIETTKINYKKLENNNPYFKYLTFLGHGDYSFSFIGETIVHAGDDGPFKAFYFEKCKYEHTVSRDEIVEAAKNLLIPGAAYPYTEIDYCVFVG